MKRRDFLKQAGAGAAAGAGITAAPFVHAAPPRLHWRMAASSSTPASQPHDPGVAPRSRKLLHPGTKDESSGNIGARSAVP
ncbi:MAG: twin-arginine translocation signal domain-containing protein, partial [Gammaproteobacteria bacterium]